MKVTRQIRLVHRITVEDYILEMMEELDILAAGVMLDVIAEGAIASGLDEEVSEYESPLGSEPMGIASTNKDSFLDYCEQSFWRQHVPNDSLDRVTELTSEIYDVFHIESGTIYTLMKQVVPENIYSEEGVYTIDEVTCTTIERDVDVIIILSCEPEEESDLS